MNYHLSQRHQHRNAVKDLTSHMTDWLVERATRSAGTKVYLITMTFDRYRDRFYVVGDDTQRLPTRHDVYAGVTQAMPQFDAAREYTNDVHNWYTRLLRLLIGRDFPAHYHRQPFAIGYLDKPVFKHRRSAGGAGLRSTDRFPHLHMVMVVDGLPSIARPERSAAEVFEQAYASGKLLEIWRRRNPEGEVHIAPIYDIEGALDYASKTAQRDPLVTDNLILLPYGERPEEM